MVLERDSLKSAEIVLTYEILISCHALPSPVLFSDQMHIVRFVGRRRAGCPPVRSSIFLYRFMLASGRAISSAVERLVYTEDAGGSIPSSPTTTNLNIMRRKFRNACSGRQLTVGDRVRYQVSPPSDGAPRLSASSLLKSFRQAFSFSSVF
jgi:hypothetical protein